LDPYPGITRKPRPALARRRGSAPAQGTVDRAAQVPAAQEMMLGRHKSRSALEAKLVFDDASSDINIYGVCVTAGAARHLVTMTLHFIFALLKHHLPELCEEGFTIKLHVARGDGQERTVAHYGTRQGDWSPGGPSQELSLGGTLGGSLARAFATPGEARALDADARPKLRRKSTLRIYDLESDSRVVEAAACKAGYRMYVGAPVGQTLTMCLWAMSLRLGRVVSSAAKSQKRD